jgi:hypothetical protein
MSAKYFTKNCPFLFHMLLTSFAFLQYTTGMCQQLLILTKNIAKILAKISVIFSYIFASNFREFTCEKFCANAKRTVSFQPKVFPSMPLPPLGKPWESLR